MNTPPFDPRQLPSAIDRWSAADILAAVASIDLDNSLQQVGTGAFVVLELDPERGAELVEDLTGRLRARGWTGDRQLAADLQAEAGGPATGRHARAVDLDLASMLVHSADLSAEGIYLNRDTGEVVSHDSTDPAIVGEDNAVDLEEGDWVGLDLAEPWAAYNDMRDFAEGVENPALRERLLRSIEGRGAFRRFRDQIFDTDFETRWHVFSDDRQWGRTRAVLAEEGISARPPRPTRPAGP